MEFLNNLNNYIETFLNSIGAWGVVGACLLIMVESMLPVLPLCVFITLLFLAFGSFLGFIISWIFTCIGCFISFKLFRSKVSGWFNKKINKGENKKTIKRLMKRVDEMSLSSLTVLVAIPFTPAFLINIACGLSKMNQKKFVTAILLGKLFMVYFWGYVGTTLIECLTDPIKLIRVLVLVLVAFVLSKFMNKYLNIE